MLARYIKHFSAEVIILLMLIGHSLANITHSNIERLFNNTILATDHRYRPSLNQSQPIRVYLSLVLFSITGVNEVQQSLSSNLQLTVTWVDETRNWDPADYGGLRKVHPDPLDIWRPRLFLSNTITDRDMFEDDYAPLTVYNTGQTKWLPGGILYTFCPMKMTYFPFDTQTCSINFTTGESSDKLQLLSPYSNVTLSSYDKNGEWLIEETQAVSIEVEDKYIVKFILKLRRLPSFTLLNIVIPVNIISSLSSLTFIMPTDGGERVSFSITVLLSLTVYTGEISKDLPTNSESLPLLIMYLACLLLHSGIAIVANMVVLIQYHHHHHQKNHQFFKRSSSNEKLSNSNTKRNKNLTGERFNTHQENKKSKKNEVSSRMDLHEIKNPTRWRAWVLQQPKNKILSINFSGLFKKSEVKNGLDSNNEDTGKPGCLATAVSRILNYMTVVDFVLFLVFFGIWLIITIVFMFLMSFQ